MTRKTIFRFAWALTILLAFSLGCKVVNQVNDVIALATDVGGLATDIDLEGLTTDIDVEGLITQVGGIATQVDLEGLSTDMGSISTEMGSFLTDIPLLGEETSGPVATPSGFPADIPVMEGEKFDMTGTATRLSYSVDAELSAAVDFYRREMTARGWAEQSYTTAEGEAELAFQKENRRIRVKVVEGFLFDVSVEITVEG